MTNNSRSPVEAAFHKFHCEHASLLVEGEGSGHWARAYRMAGENLSFSSFEGGFLAAEKNHAKALKELESLREENAKLKQERDRLKDDLSAFNDGQKAIQQLARRTLWLAYVWNDHNFGPAHQEARLEAVKHGITSLAEANAFIQAMPELSSDHDAEQKSHG